MENLVKKVSSVTTAWIVLGLLVLSLVSLFVFKLNLSPDFTSARVLVVELDHADSSDNVQLVADTILKTSQVVKEGTSKFYLYFQNVDDTKINDFKVKFATVQAGVTSMGDYNFSYAGEVLIFERILILGVIGFIAYAVYVSFSLKGLGFRRLDIWPIIVVELLIFTFSLLVLLGVGSLLGGLGLSMNFNYWTMFLMAFAVLTTSRIYTTFRFKDITKKETTTDLSVLYTMLYKRYWPEFVFLFCLAIIICVLPFVVLGKAFLLSDILVLVACFLAFFNFAFMQRDLFKFWNNWGFASGKKFKARSSWLKKW